MSSPSKFKQGDMVQIRTPLGSSANLYPYTGKIGTVIAPPFLAAPNDRYAGQWRYPLDVFDCSARLNPIEPALRLIKGGGLPAEKTDAEHFKDFLTEHHL